MTLRLGQHVAYGEIRNSRNHSVNGRMKFWGSREPFVLELTGNMSADLKGKTVRFAARRKVWCGLKRQKADKAWLKGIRQHQIGATGTMTAAHRVKVFEGPIDEYVKRCSAGEPPPTEWKRCLYLEWFSQNGRVVLELIDPVLEVLDARMADGQELWVPMAEPDWEEEEAEAKPALDISVIEIDGDGDARISRETFESGGDGGDAFGHDGNLQHAADAHGLEAYLEKQRQETDRAAGLAAAGRSEEDEVIRECELMDHCIDNEPGECLRSMLDPAAYELDLDTIPDDEAEAALKVQLGHLAMYGIALHMCEHYTPREALRLLLGELGREARPFPQLAGSNWTTNYLTAEYCRQCDEEAEERYGSQSGAPDGV